jgi:hypothetical protein
MKKILVSLAALFSAVAFGATTLPVQLINPTGSSSGQAIVSNGASSAPAWGGIGVNGIAAIAANTVLANATASSASPTAFSMPSCSSSTSVLQWASGTGFQCVTGLPGRLINVQVFTSSGTYTPTSGQGHAIVKLQCAGGGSGGTATTTSSQYSVSSGAGSGGYAEVYYGALSTTTVTIGAGGTAGAGGASPTAGGTGGTTSFGSAISCTGGGGSVAGAAQADTNYYIGTAASGGAAPTISGGTTVLDLAGAQPQVRAMIMGSTTNPTSGAGANSILGQGGFQSQGSAASPVGYGAGAGGAATNVSTTGNAGAVGGGGYIAVYEYQ